MLCLEYPMKMNKRGPVYFIGALIILSRDIYANNYLFLPSV